jgi:hypothetical protein
MREGGRATDLGQRWEAKWRESDAGRGRLRVGAGALQRRVRGVEWGWSVVGGGGLHRRKWSPRLAVSGEAV